MLPGPPKIPDEEPDSCIKEQTSLHEDLLLFKYRRYRYKFQHLLDSFEHFIDNDIKACFEGRPIILNDGREATLFISDIIKPRYIPEGSESYVNLTRHVAIAEKRSYSCSLYVGIKITDGTSEEFSSNTYKLMDIPVPVYGKYCHDHQYLNKVMGEGRYPDDPGCYYILDGEKYLVLLYEKARYNQYRISTDKNDKSKKLFPYISQLSETAFSTSSIEIYFDQDKEDNIIVGVNLHKPGVSLGRNYKGQSAEDTTEEEVDITSKKTQRPPGFNVISLCYALLKLTSKYKNMKKTEMKDSFVYKLKTFIPAEQFFDCYSLFLITAKLFSESSHDSILQSIALRLGLNYQDKKFNDYLIIYIDNQILPSWSNYERKVDTLICMTARLLQCKTGKVGLTDKGNWAHMGLSMPGSIFTGIFKRKYMSLVEELMSSPGFSAAKTADDILSLINGNKIESKYLKEFRPPFQGGASWKTTKPQSKARDAIAIIINPINNTDINTMLTKTRNNASPDSPAMRPRMAEGSSWRFFDLFRVTETKKCGITKFVASTTIITCNEDPEIVIKALTEITYAPLKFPVVSKNYIPNIMTIPVTINGLPIGYTNSENGYKNIVLLKRAGKIPRTSCIVKTDFGVLEIYVDAHRMMIPSVVFDLETQLPLLYNKKYSGWETMTFDRLLRLGLIEYIDNYEIENRNINFAQTFNSIVGYQSEMQFLKSSLNQSNLDGNEILSENLRHEISTMMNGSFSHASIHPISAYSGTTALVPYSDSQQSCRTAYSGKMQDQSIHRCLDNPFEHKSSYKMANITRSLVSPSTANILGFEREISGQTVTVAFYSTQENQEDACVINKAAIDMGLFRYRRTIVIKESLENNSQRFGLYNDGSIHPYKMRHIGLNGVPNTGVHVSEGDYVIGKYEIKKVEINGKERDVISNMSVRLSREESGEIKEVMTYYTYKPNQEKQKTVSVRIESFERADRGDKFSTRHSQKYIAALIKDDQDMIFRRDGTRIDVAFNPLCVITRMTTGTLLEPLTGKASSIDGAIRDVAAYKQRDIAGMKKALMNAGYCPNGTEIVYSGETGEEIEAEVYVGKMRVSMLAHIGKEKVQCRGIGKKNKITRQAESSKIGVAADKGQKIGEYERDKLLQYHSKFFIHERMNLSCDGVTIVICIICSSYATFKPEIGKFECPICRTSASGSSKTMFGKYIMPQTSMYLFAGLATIGTLPRPKFMTRSKYLKGHSYSAAEEGENYGEGECGDEDCFD
jgi:DNA-directed RNA polymerase beta subunit